MCPTYQGGPTRPAWAQGSLPGSDESVKSLGHPGSLSDLAAVTQPCLTQASSSRGPQQWPGLGCPRCLLARSGPPTLSHRSPHRPAHCSVRKQPTPLPQAPKVLLLRPRSQAERWGAFPAALRHVSGDSLALTEKSRIEVESPGQGFRLTWVQIPAPPC